MARRLRIEWRKGDKVTALLTMPARPRSPGVLLAHGAGAGQASWFMAELREGLAREGYPAMTFDYPYVEAGRKRPDHQRTLEACHVAAAARLTTYVPQIVLAGKSMGGRIGGHVAREVGAIGLVFYGYPLVSISGTARPLDHLVGLDIPQLFVAGTRDRLGPLPRLRRAVATIGRAEAALIEGGDHSLKVPKASGLTHSEVISGVVRITADWLEQL